MGVRAGDTPRARHARKLQAICLPLDYLIVNGTAATVFAQLNAIAP